MGGKWSALTDGAPSPANSQREDRFTERSFHEHLVNFIVADDQVRKAQFAALLSTSKDNLLSYLLRTYSLFVRLLLQCFQGLCVHKTTHNDL
jgi:hypothetical protein